MLDYDRKLAFLYRCHIPLKYYIIDVFMKYFLLKSK